MSKHKSLSRKEAMKYAATLGLGPEHITKKVDTEEKKPTKKRSKNLEEQSREGQSREGQSREEQSNNEKRKFMDKIVDDDIFAGLPPFDNLDKYAKLNDRSSEHSYNDNYTSRNKHTNKYTADKQSNDKHTNKQSNDKQSLNKPNNQLISKDYAESYVKEPNKQIKVSTKSPNAQLIKTLDNKDSYAQHDAILIIKQADYCKAQIKKSKDVLKSLNQEAQLVKMVSMSHKSSTAPIVSTLDISDIVEEINDILSNSRSYWDAQVMSAQNKLTNKVAEVRALCEDYQSLRQLQTKILSTFPDKGRYLLDQMAKTDMGTHDEIPLHSDDWDAFNRNFMNTAVYARDEFEDAQESLDYNFGTSIESSHRF